MYYLKGAQRHGLLDSGWALAVGCLALVDSDTRQSFRPTVFKNWLLNGEGTLGGLPRKHCVQMSAAAIIQPMLLTLSQDTGGSSEGGNKCSEAGYILKVESIEVANELEDGGKEKQEGYLQGCCPEQLGDSHGDGKDGDERESLGRGCQLQIKSLIWTRVWFEGLEAYWTSK